MHLMLLGIRWYQFVQNDDVWRLTKQPKLTAIIQSRRLTLFGHIMRMDDNADAKRILLASPPADWRRQPGRPCITWLSTVQQDLKQHHVTLPEAADLAQNRPVWRMMSTYGATQSLSCMLETTTTKWGSCDGSVLLFVCLSVTIAYWWRRGLIMSAVWAALACLIADRWNLIKLNQIRSFQVNKWVVGCNSMSSHQSVEAPSGECLRGKGR